MTRPKSRSARTEVPAGGRPEERPAPGGVSSALCLTCGLCCDGTLFGSVELLLEDDEQRLAALGLEIRRPGRPRFSQPCRALDAGGCCAIYRERPGQCRVFECALLRQVKAGRQTPEQARKTIRQARRKAEEIRQLLRSLGECNESRPLSRRFHTVKRRMEQGGGETVADREATLDRFATLSLAVHDLQLLLRREFYPDPADLADA